MLHKKRIISLFLIFALSLGLTMQSQATDIKEVEKKGDELEEQKNAAEEQKKSLTAELESILGEMEEIQEQMAAKEAEIQQKEEELVQAKVDENNQYESMKKRIQYMYETGNAEFIEILFASESIGEFLNNAEYITTMSEYDREQLTKFRDIVDLVAQQEAELKSEYEELSALQTALGEKQQSVEQLLAETSTKIEDLEAQIGENAALLEKLMKEAEEAAERERQRLAALAAQQAAQAGRGGGSAYVTAGPSVVSGNG